MQEQPGSAPHRQADSGRADVGHSPAYQQLPHAQKYMLLHVLSQQLEAGQIEQVMQQIKDELGPGFLERHPDLLFELQRCGTLYLVQLQFHRAARTPLQYLLLTLQSGWLPCNALSVTRPSLHGSTSAIRVVSRQVMNLEEETSVHASCPLCSHQSVSCLL